MILLSMAQPALRTGKPTLKFITACVWQHHLGVTRRHFSRGSTQMAKDYYRDLELDSYASSADIKKAYYELSKKYHPDLNSDQDPESLKRFHAITEAYDVLGDPRKRRKYDKGSFVGSASERDDHELVKYKYKGEEFMQKRSETKDRYSGEGAYCSIRSNKTTERGRKMDDSVMRLRRKAFERNQQFDSNADFYEKRHNLKARNEALKGPRHHSYTRSSSVQSGNSGGGGVGSVAIIFVFVLLVFFRLKG